MNPDDAARARTGRGKPGPHFQRARRGTVPRHHRHMDTPGNRVAPEGPLAPPHDERLHRECACPGYPQRSWRRRLLQRHARPGRADAGRVRRRCVHASGFSVLGSCSGYGHVEARVIRQVRFGSRSRVRGSEHAIELDVRAAALHAGSHATGSHLSGQGALQVLRQQHLDESALHPHRQGAHAARPTGHGAYACPHGQDIQAYVVCASTPHLVRRS